LTLTPGARLGPYEIVAPLGAGGMGEVYRAKDTRLGREVALKILPESFAGDSDRLMRFEREARTVASLNHPNIAAIYGVESNALVMELIEGDDLSDRIAKGAMPIEDALPIARQIADALEAAHEAGVIHRDLKPANIKVRQDGTVKVLDFGLAKGVDAPVSASGAPESLTMTSPAMTQAGMILGTAAYMSPEQARGKAVDKRSDIWAFGVVLFEMLTGTRAFGDEDVSMTLSRILQREPDFDALPAALPARVVQVLRLCLRKDPKQRAGDIRDVRLALDGAFDSVAAPAPASAVPERNRSRERVAWTAFGIASLAALALAFAAFGRAPALESKRVVRLQALLPEGFATSGVNGGWAQIAPDGSALLMTGSGGLYLRSLESGETTLIPDTSAAFYPFWSADSQHIAFFRQGRLKRMAARGGPVLDICAAPDPRGGSWNKDDVIIFAPGLSTGLHEVSAGGGTPRVVVAPTPGVSGEYIRYPSFLPDGQHFLFQRTTPDESGFYLGSLKGTPARLLRPITSSAVYAPPLGGEPLGRLLFLVNRTTLVSQPFDVGTLQLTGEMSPVAEGVAFAGQAGNGAFSVSDGGVLIYASASSLKTQLALLDRLGGQVARIGSPVDAPDVAISPDGRQIAYSPSDLRTLFLQQVSGGPPTRITEATAISPVWSPDGRVAFSRPGVRYELFIKHLDGAAQEQPLGVGAPNASPTDWSADGKWIAFNATDNSTGADLWLLPLKGDGKPVAFLATPAPEGYARFSPDSKWMAYGQLESGRGEVFVQAISPQGTATGIKYRISPGGGWLPRWRGDGKELVYASDDGKVIGVAIVLGATVGIGAPQVLFDLPEGASLLDMDENAQRFLVGVPAGAGARANALTVIMNWQAGVAQRKPVAR
jgi:Tol biopolymer transport system component